MNNQLTTTSTIHHITYWNKNSTKIQCTI